MIYRRSTLWLIRFLLIGLITGACSGPRPLPEGPTPIPTLVPVTLIPEAIEPTPIPSSRVLSYPARAPSSHEGQAFYSEYCSECHGEDGSGVYPDARNFQDLDYMRGETATNFYTVVNEGRGEMPGYNGTLSSDEIWDTVFYVIRLATDTGILDTGMDIYDGNCSSCHGEEGSGDLLGSADFSDLQQMADLASRDLYLSITQGSGSMPAWQSLLSQDDRWAVIDYLRTFHYDPTLEEDSVSEEISDEQATEIPTIACDLEQDTPISWDDSAAIAAGEVIYNDQCAICHGADATGGLPNTPDFTSPEYIIALQDNPGEAFCVLSEGEGAMPAFGNKMTQEELWQTMIYLGALSP